MVMLVILQGLVRPLAEYYYQEVLLAEDVCLKSVVGQDCVMGCEAE